MAFGFHMIEFSLMIIILFFFRDYPMIRLISIQTHRKSLSYLYLIQRLLGNSRFQKNSLMFIGEEE